MILKHLWVPLPLCSGHGPEWSQGGNQGVPEKRGRFFRSGRHVAIYMGAKMKVHNVCVIYAQYFFFDTRSRDELPPSFRQIQFWSSHTSFSSWSFPTTRKEVKRIIRSRDNRRIRLKYLRGHLPHIWTFTSRAWIVKAWANGRENRRLSMRNIFQFDVQVNVNEYNLRNEKNWALSYVWQDCIHALYSSKY